MQANCGPQLGNRTFMCGPAMGGKPISYKCPGMAPTPTCVWFDKQRGVWSKEGCEVAGVSETAVTCACSHLTDFSIRYTALPVPSASVYAPQSAPPVTIFLALLLFPGYYAVLAVICLWFLVLAYLGFRWDSKERGLFISALLSHPEVEATSRYPPPTSFTVQLQLGLSCCSLLRRNPKSATALVAPEKVGGEADLTFPASMLTQVFATIPLFTAPSQPPLGDFPAITTVLFRWSVYLAAQSHPIFSPLSPSSSFTPYLLRCSRAVLTLLSSMGLLCFCAGVYVTLVPPSLGPNSSTEIEGLTWVGVICVGILGLFVLAPAHAISAYLLSLQEAWYLRSNAPALLYEDYARASADTLLQGLPTPHLMQYASGGNAGHPDHSFSTLLSLFSITVSRSLKEQWPAWTTPVLVTTLTVLSLFYSLYYAVLFPLLRGSIATTSLLCAWALSFGLLSIVTPIPSAACLLWWKLALKPRLLALLRRGASPLTPHPPTLVERVYLLSFPHATAKVARPVRGAWPADATLLAVNWRGALAGRLGELLLSSSDACNGVGHDEMLRQSLVHACYLRLRKEGGIPSLAFSAPAPVAIAKPTLETPKSTSAESVNDPLLSPASSPEDDFKGLAQSMALWERGRKERVFGDIPPLMPLPQISARLLLPRPPPMRLFTNFPALRGQGGVFLRGVGASSLPRLHPRVRPVPPRQPPPAILLKQSQQ